MLPGHLLFDYAHAACWMQPETPLTSSFQEVSAELFGVRKPHLLMPQNADATQQLSLLACSTFSTLARWL
jgi:hypothetical protein